MVVEKPAGVQVHTPEAMSARGEVLFRNNAQRILKAQLGRWVYPVHRLDRSTSGVLLFALDPEMARDLQSLFQKKEIKKTYLALVRGWLEDDSIIDSPLDEKDALTHYSTLSRFEIPVSVGQHPTSRYSLMEVSPITGRFHQIRRHFKHLSHPLIGDSVYGDGRHNRIWKELCPGAKLFLKSYRIEFVHPRTKVKISCHSRFGNTWLRLFDQIGTCPLI